MGEGGVEKPEKMPMTVPKQLEIFQLFRTFWWAAPSITRVILVLVRGFAYQIYTSPKNGNGSERKYLDSCFGITSIMEFKFMTTVSILGQKALSFFYVSGNVWVIENLTMRSSNTLLRLVRFSATQMIHLFPSWPVWVRNQVCYACCSAETAHKLD